MTHNDRSKPIDTSEEVVSAARVWAERIAERDLTASERQRFEEWLRDPNHEMEFFAEFEIRFRLQQIPESEREVVRSEAAPPPTPPRYLPERRRLWMRRKLIAAAALVLLAVGAVWVGFLSHPHYVTGVGERLSTVLSDGTRVELDAQTDLQWLGLGRCDRRVRLLRGEALFNVRRDPRCPFQVLVGRGSRIEVLGTEFDVYQHHLGEQRVTVLEGRVRIHGLPMATGSSPWQVDLGAGQQSTWSTGLPSTRTLEDPSKVTAWREDRLDFADQPLTEVIEDLQRHTSIPIRIADPRLQSIHVTGELQVDELHIRPSVLRLAQRPEIEVKDDGHSLTLTYRSQAPTNREKGRP